jgi:hypothetical protein
MMSQDVMLRTVESETVNTGQPSFIWVFSGGRQFPGGVFTSVEKAETWIAQHGLTGVLTRYPVDEGCFDWAIRTGLHGLSEKSLAAKREDAEFIGGFSSAAQDHIHYEAGKRA